MMDVDEAAGGGGFMADEPEAGPAPIPGLPSLRRQPDSDEDDGGEPSLPFTKLIPALRSLRLPYDSDVLETFRACADGEELEGDAADDLLTVSRENFSRVCAVLFANQADDDDELSSGEAYEEADDDPVISPSEKRTRSKGKAPAIQLSGDDEDDADAQAVSTDKSAAPMPAKAKGSRKKARTTGELSAEKRALVERVFRLFQPIQTARGPVISYEGVRSVAQLLKQSLNDAELNEMLEYASSTQNRYVDLSAFSEVMRAVRAV